MLARRVRMRAAAREARTLGVGASGPHGAALLALVLLASAAWHVEAGCVALTPQWHTARLRAPRVLCATFLPVQSRLGCLPILSPFETESE